MAVLARDDRFPRHQRHASVWVIPGDLPAPQKRVRAQLHANRPHHLRQSRHAPPTLQPIVGWYTDKWPKPFSLAIGMTFTLCGLARWRSRIFSAHFYLAVALMASAPTVFHPRGFADRSARLGRTSGFAQSISSKLAATPALPSARLSWAALIIDSHTDAKRALDLPSRRGRALRCFFARIAPCGIEPRVKAPRDKALPMTAVCLPRGRVMIALGILVLLMFFRSIFISQA